MAARCILTDSFYSRFAAFPNWIRLNRTYWAFYRSIGDFKVPPELSLQATRHDFVGEVREHFGEFPFGAKAAELSPQDAGISRRGALPGAGEGRLTGCGKFAG